MPRTLDPLMAAACQSGAFYGFLAVQVTFQTGTYSIWSGPYPMTLNGQVYTGVGDLGTISSVKETIETEATGLTISLSGVDPAILQACLDDVQLGAPCVVYFGVLNPVTGQPLGQPAVYYQGLVDQPTHQSSPTACTISLAVESRLLRLQGGGQQLKYTSADQRLLYPDDTFFQWVEQDNNLAYKWGYA